MRAVLIGLALGLLPSASYADGRTDLECAEEAERAFQKGVASKPRFLEARKHFSEAADRWRELHDRGVRSPALYRNLGNAAALADRWSEAIWAYHLGLALDPNDRELRDQLAFARGKTLYPPSGIGKPAQDLWPEWLHRPSLGEWSAALALAYATLCIAGLLAFIRPNGRLRAVCLIALGITVAAGIGVWKAAAQMDIDRAMPLVIVADNTPFYRGNGPSYPRHPDLPILPRGLEARQIHRRGNWLMVKLTSGEVGWLPAERALIVEP